MRIVLVGFMGVGKTSIGKVLSKRLNLDFFDTDIEIEKEYGSIENIFESFGEDYFRNLETKVLNSIIKKDNLVISTGGGVVIRNSDVLKELEKVVFLDSNVENIYNNIKNDTKKRPLLKDCDIKEKIETLLNKRYNLYESVSNIKIKAENKTVDEISEEIILKLGVIWKYLL